MTCLGENPVVTVDREDESVSEGIVSAVANLSDTPPNILPPLHDAVDPAALEAVFTSLGAGHVTFRYADFTVCVEDGTIAISEDSYTSALE